MRLFRRPTRAREFSDYRSVADAVQARRATRKERPETLVSPEDLHDSTRAYQPSERLRSVSEDVQQFQRNCEGMPRTWEEEKPPRDTPTVLLLLLVAIFAMCWLYESGYF